MKRLIYILSLGVVILIAACTNRRPEAPERLPDGEMGAYREACIKLYPYVTLEDSTYHINISKSEAAKLQIPEKYYDRLQADLDYTNYLIREEYNKRGLPIDLPRPQIDTPSQLNH